MDPSTTTNPVVKYPNPNSVPIRVSKSTARMLKSIVAKCNRKSHGRKVKNDDVIEKSLKLLSELEIEQIKESTFSSQDKLEIEFKKYCKKNGSISKDKFLQIILNRAIPEVANDEVASSQKIT